METKIDDLRTNFYDNSQMIVPQSAAETERGCDSRVANGGCVVAADAELTLSPSASNGSALNTSPVRTSDSDQRSENFTHQNSGELDKHSPTGISESIIGPFRQVSIFWIMAIVVLSFAVIAASLVPTITEITQQAARIFYASLYGTSIVCLIILLTFGIIDGLSLQENHHDNGAVTFHKVGAVVLGTGSIIYEVINIVVHSAGQGDCVTSIVQSSLAIVFIVLEIGLFLNYSKVVINKGSVLSILALFMVSQLTSTNIAVWFYAVVIETMEGTNASSNAGNCEPYTQLREILSPYLFPLIVEYSVVAMVMTLAMWEKCGWREPDFYITSSRHQIVTTSLSVNAFSTDSRQHANSFHNNHVGFVLGWLILIGSIVVAIVYLFYMYTGSVGEAGVMETVAYGWDIAIKLHCLFALIFCFVRMSALTFKSSELVIAHRHRNHQPMPLTRSSKITRQLDQQLTNITFFALLIYQVLQLIIAIETKQYIIIADISLTVCTAAVQTVFIVPFAANRRSTTEEHRMVRPGRQALEMLRIANLALWGLGTLVFKNSVDNYQTGEFSSGNAWKIISNITQPLEILFYFHCVGGFTEVINHAYTAKYVGLIIPTTGNGTVSVSDSSGAGDVPDTLLLVKSTSTSYSRQRSKTSLMYGQREGQLSRMSSVHSNL